MSNTRSPNSVADCQPRPPKTTTSSSSAAAKTPSNDQNPSAPRPPSHHRTSMWSGTMCPRAPKSIPETPPVSPPAALPFPPSKTAPPATRALDQPAVRHPCPRSPPSKCPSLPLPPFQQHVFHLASLVSTSIPKALPQRPPPMTPNRRAASSRANSCTAAKRPRRSSVAWPGAQTAASC